MVNNHVKSYTKEEILGQPTLWISVYQLILNNRNKISGFLEPLFQLKDLQIVLTGAGSSAFIGEAAQGLVQKNTGFNTKAIATTDIVTHPELFFQAEIPTLLISFARSGNSPESLETVGLADKFCKNIHHLIISCNKDGKLAHYAYGNQERSYLVLLPEAANDKSLAMTGSFTSMLLSVLLISDIYNIAKREAEISQISKQAKILLDQSDVIKKIAKSNFDRVVFLGSGPMLGIARECHLKLQELTDGQIICKHDSFLGFRHGPRAVTNENTLLVYLFSASDFVHRYEVDLAMSIAEDIRNIKCLSIGRPENKKLNSCLNIDLHLEENQKLNIIPTTLIGQLLGYYKSLQKGLNPDNPSISGAINRVVQGVTIYNKQNIN
ncbi:SIS domain-containing protein [Autumnicola musiva]|uniref:SIS domain-containing protein n=1 Tax=Autumnicola musiva TaxID=3075589 RepID=A0ABU3DAL0_9FLAO|nr:SIS domain-containing protein [Zunongwangia sp. F117]MDT0678567.1 SIS domain-containing protein [Zunongwangia sp. F117]